MPEYDKKSVTAQLEQLQLEETQERVDAARATRKARINRNRQMALTIERGDAIRKAQQDACWHKKGGKGVTMLSQGNDHNFAVVKHQLCHGPIIVVCQRCSKLWEPPLKPAKGASAEERTKYREDLAEYHRALNLPTDNEQSGTQLFVIGIAEPAA
jgi:hypothetical protein